MATTLENFGRNVRVAPAELLMPHRVDDVLACLDKHRGRAIRAVGSLHSWSDAAVCQGVVLDLRHLNGVALKGSSDGTVEADIAAGCTIDQALERLHSIGHTLPVYGIIGKQTIAGAISTATHGSGRPSLSHYVTAITSAAYDAAGTPRIYEWKGNDALLAARCALGCAGILLSVRIQTEPDFLVEEQTRWFKRLDDVLQSETEFPRQQFYLVPWSWRWYAQMRRELAVGDGTRPGRTALFHRGLRTIGADVVLNGAVKLLATATRRPTGIKGFHRRVFPMFAQSGLHVIDHSRQLLQMRHDMYRHIEMELFVPAVHVQHAAAFVEWVLRWCGGESPQLPVILVDDSFGVDLGHEIRALHRTYVHDYVVTFRRVLRDDTLISMTSGASADAWYAISLITYQRTHAAFVRMARFLAATMAAAYQARPHWGKIFPLGRDEIARLYPALPRFRAHCAAVDPEQTFVNDFVRRALGF